MNSLAPGSRCSGSVNPLSLSQLLSCILALSEHSISRSNSVFCAPEKAPKACFSEPTLLHLSHSLLMYIFQLLPTLSGSEVANTRGERANEQSSG